MKVTKYIHRYSISLTENEWFALRALVSHGKTDFVDEGQIKGLDSGVRRVILSDRWRQIGGPLSVDVEAKGRGLKLDDSATRFAVRS